MEDQAVEHFKPNRAFRRQYNRIFRRDPLAANVFLLLAELANSEGRIVIPEPSAEMIAEFMSERFQDPRRYHL